MCVCQWVEGVHGSVYGLTGSECVGSECVSCECHVEVELCVWLLGGLSLCFVVTSRRAKEKSFFESLVSSLSPMRPLKDRLVAVDTSVS